MSYIGAKPQPVAFHTIPQDLFSGDGSTTGFTLSQTPANPRAILVMIDGVKQYGGEHYTLTGPTLNFVAAPPSGTNNIEVLFLNRQEAIGQISADNVRYNNGNLTQVLDNSLSNNLIINGNFDIDQENVGSRVNMNVSGIYGPDMWRWNKIGAGSIDYALSTSVVPNNGFSANSMELTVNTADASIAAGDNYNIQTYVEGYDYKSLHNGKEITLGFWVSSSVTGTYCVSYNNATANRSYVAEFTITTADTLEYKTITIKTDTAGTWDFTNGIGLRVTFALAAGTTYQTTADTWQAGQYYATSNQVNWMGTASNTFYLSQVQLVEGTIAVKYNQLIKSFKQLLAFCKRYYQKSYDPGTVPGTVTNVGSFRERFVYNNNQSSIWFNIAMRTAPTMTGYNPAILNTTGSVRDFDNSANRTITGFVNTSQNKTQMNTAGNVGSADTGAHWVADARF